MSLVEQYIQSELGTTIGGSEIILTTARNELMSGWYVQLQVGNLFHAGVFLSDRQLESMAAPEVYVRSIAKELTRLVKRTIYDDHGCETVADFAEFIFEELGILIGGEW